MLPAAPAVCRTLGDSLSFRFSFSPAVNIILWKVYCGGLSLPPANGLHTRISLICMKSCCLCSPAVPAARQTASAPGTSKHSPLRQTAPAKITNSLRSNSVIFAGKASSDSARSPAACADCLPHSRTADGCRQNSRQLQQRCTEYDNHSGKGRTTA